jgi:thiamine-monophosphate kinase
MKEDVFLGIIRSALPESTQYLGDDTAWISEEGLAKGGLTKSGLILTQDALVEDVHFRTHTMNPYFLGRKSIIVNLSDIAAAGGIAKYVLISLSLPKDIDEDFLMEFYRGVRSASNEYGVVVVGGDLTGAEKITISVSVVGFDGGVIPANRRNALVGDVVVVTGNFGSAAAGLFLQEETYKETGFEETIPLEVRAKFITAHINPIPRLPEGRKILEIAGMPAMMDSSDGLCDTVHRISEMSGVSMELDYSEIPFDKDLYTVFKKEGMVKKAVLFGGEDYQLVATVSEEAYNRLKDQLSVKKIGVVKEAENNCFGYVKFKDGTRFKIDSKSLDAGLYKHFE